MTDGEKLDLLLAEMQGMKSEMQGMKSEMHGMKTEIQGMKSEMQNMGCRLDSLELQVNQTERILKNEIRKSETLILDEVERVHNILDKHQNDTTKQTA